MCDYTILLTKYCFTKSLYNKNISLLNFHLSTAKWVLEIHLLVYMISLLCDYTLNKNIHFLVYIYPLLCLVDLWRSQTCNIIVK